MLALSGIKGRVDQHLEETRRSLPLRLRTALDRLLAERGLLTPDPACYFGVMGHPLFELPAWVAARLRAGGDPVADSDLDGALGASALGYLHARAQDDWLDGGAPHDPTLVALADVLLARCTRLLVAVVGASPRFWGRYDEVMATYAESLLHADELRRTGADVTRPAFEQLLEQSRPLAIPSLALLDRAGRWDLAAALEEFVVAEAGAAQLFNDLTDYHRDREAGQPTWAGAAIDAAGGPLWRDLLGGAGAAGTGAGDGVLAERVREALAYHDGAVRAARSLGLVDAQRWLGERSDRLVHLEIALRAELVAAFAERLAGTATQPPRGGQETSGPQAARRERARRKGSA